VNKVLVIMRGLPWTGKSYTAKQLAGENGLVFSTDEYWYKINCPEKPDEYSFLATKLKEAHLWNQTRAFEAMDRGHPLVIIDNTNTTGSEAKCYVEHGLKCGYEIQIQEPTSPRWCAIRDLLRCKKQNKDELRMYAAILAEGSKQTHSVPKYIIEKMMWRWENDITVDSILFPKNEGDFCE
jgi:predicted kinase